MSGYIQTNQSISIPDADFNLTAADSGKIIFFGSTAGVAKTINLPLLAANIPAGTHYRIVNNSLAALAFPRNITGGAGAMYGGIININANVAATIPVAGLTTVSFSTASLKGDIVDLYYDGATWSVTGMGRVNNAITAI